MVVSGLAWVGCSPKSTGDGARRESAGVVHLATWSNYISAEMLADFARETGIQVKVSNYSSNEELLAKLQAGASGYDVAVPSDYMVFAMIQLGLLLPLDAAKMPSRKGIDPRFMGQRYDPENKFSIPYDWGTTGLAVNRTLFAGRLKSWKDLFSQEALKGKFTLLDDVRESMGAALKYQGRSLNTKDEAQIAEAKKFLLSIKSAVKAFTSEPLVPLVDGEVAVAHVYMSDALQAARKTGGKIEYVIPEEGATLWVDNLVIPKGAVNVEGAHRLMEYLLRPKNAAATVTAVLVAPTVLGVASFLSPELRANPFLFPGTHQRAGLEMMEDLGEALRMYDRAWTEVKAASN